MKVPVVRAATLRIAGRGLSIPGCLSPSCIPPNPQAWKKGPGLISILEFSRSAPSSFTSEAVTVTEKLCRDEDELVVLTEFLMHGVPQEKLKLRAALLQLLYDVIRATPEMAQVFLRAGAMPLVAGCLCSQHEQIQVLGIKLLSLLLHVSKSTWTQFWGFDVCYHLLSKGCITVLTFNSLFKCALDAFRPAEEPPQRPSTLQRRCSPLPSSPMHATFNSYLPVNRSDPDLRGSLSVTIATDSFLEGDASLSNILFQQSDDQRDHIMHPQVIKVIMCLLADTCRRPAEASPAPAGPNVLQLVMRYLDAILNVPENVDILLNHTATHWMDILWGLLSVGEAAVDPMDLEPCSPVSDGRDRLPGENPQGQGDRASVQSLAEMLRPKITKLLIADLCRHPRQCTAFSLRDMADARAFQIMTLECLISHFQINPRLPANEFQNILKNLHRLVDCIENAVALPVPLLLGLINMLGLLAVQNTSEVRSYMKVLGLLGTRDCLALYLLNVDVSLPSLCHLESLGFQPGREANTLLVLMLKFHEAQGDPDIQKAIINVIRTIYDDEEQRQQLLRLLDDPQVVEVLLNQRKTEEWDTDDDDWTADNFIIWYSASEQGPQRQAIMDRVQQAAKSHEAALSRHQQKRRIEYEKRLQRRVRMKHKESERIMKAIAEMEEAAAEYSRQTLESYTHRTQGFHEQQKQRTQGALKIRPHENHRCQS